MSVLFPTLGAAVALAGLDKLVGTRGYARMFGHLDWTEGEMRAAALAEVSGGLLMMPSSTRWLGGTIVAAASAAVLSSELRRGDARLAAPRGLVLLGALAAVASRRRSR